MLGKFERRDNKENSVTPQQQEPAKTEKKNEPKKDVRNPAPAKNNFMLEEDRSSENSPQQEKTAEKQVLLTEIPATPEEEPSQRESALQKNMQEIEELVARDEASPEIISKNLASDFNMGQNHQIKDEV